MRHSQPLTRNSPLMFHGKTRQILAFVGLLAIGGARPPRTRSRSRRSPCLSRSTAGASPSEPIQVHAKVEASAVEPIGDGKFVLIAHDKASEFYVVETATGKIIGPPVTSDALPATTASGPKFEGMARDSKGNFYAIGSHSGKTDDERGQRAHLGQIPAQGQPQARRGTEYRRRLGPPL